MMKKILSWMSVLLLVFTLGACSTSPEKTPSQEETPLEEETPSTNQDEEPNVENNGPIDPLIAYEGVPRDHVIYPVTEEDAMKQFETGTGILVLSRPTCGWCQLVMPVIDEVAKTMELDHIYYLDTTTVTTDEQKEALQVLVDDHLKVEEEGIIVYTPDVYAFKDGEVVGRQLGGVSADTEEEQVSELVKIYTDLFSLIK